MTSYPVLRSAQEGPRRGGEALLIALLLAVATLAFAQSCQRWLDPIIDTGRDLYIPEQIDHGAKLYRDIRYQYPPLTPYLLAAITAVIGHSLASYTAIGLLQSAFIVVILWLIGRRTAGPVGGFTASLLFVALDFCGASTWGANFLFPYSYAATIGIGCLLGSLALFLYDRPVLALAALLAAAFCKVEYAIAAGFIALVLAAARRISLRQLAGFVLAGSLVAGGAWAWFPNILDNVFAKALTRGEAARIFYGSVAGFGAWRQNLLAASLAIVGMGAIAWLLRSQSPVGVVAVIAVSVLLTNDGFFRGWGLLQVAALVVGFRERNSPLLVLSLFSMASTLRIAFNTTPAWYGFALVLPLYVLIGYVLFNDLPRRGLYPARMALWWIPLLAFLCGKGLAEQRLRYSVKSFPITSARGTFYDANPDRARVLDQFIGVVRSGTLAVMPEGITLNYLTGTTTPLTYHTFTPPETANRGAEDSIVRELETRPPARIAIVSRDVTEYGFQGFGVDYDQRIWAYLIDHYRLERDWNEEGFRLQLLRYESITLRNRGKAGGVGIPE